LGSLKSARVAHSFLQKWFQEKATQFSNRTLLVNFTIMGNFMKQKIMCLFFILFIFSGVARADDTLLHTTTQ